MIAALVCVLITSLFIKSSIDLKINDNFTVIDLPIFGMVGALICVVQGLTYRFLFKQGKVLDCKLVIWHVLLTVFSLLFIIVTCMRPPIVFDDVVGIFDKIRLCFFIGVGVFLVGQGIFVVNVLTNNDVEH